MVKIRLKRMGGHKKPFYRVVVADSRNARNGRFIEELGYYDPMVEPPVIKIDGEKAQKWIDNGAQVSDTVRALLKKAGMQGSEQGKKAAKEDKKEAPAEDKAEEEAPAEEEAEKKDEAEVKEEEAEDESQEKADTEKEDK